MVERSGIILDEAAPRKLQRTIKVNGQITANKDRMACVIPRFPGIAKAVRKKLGDKVQEGEVLADATIYGIALYAVGKPNSAKRRAAFISGIFQGVLGLLVASDLIRRFLFGSEPTSLAMITVGAAALAANVTCLWLLRKQRHGEVHTRASWIFTRTDTLANVGTIFGGAMVLVTKRAMPDLIVGAPICLVALLGRFEIIRDAASDRLSELSKVFRNE